MKPETGWGAQDEVEKMLFLVMQFIWKQLSSSLLKSRADGPYILYLSAKGQYAFHLRWCSDYLHTHVSVRLGEINTRFVTPQNPFQCQCVSRRDLRLKKTSALLRWGESGDLLLHQHQSADSWLHSTVNNQTPRGPFPLTYTVFWEGGSF